MSEPFVDWISVTRCQVQAATRDEPTRFDIAIGDCFSFNQAATSSGSKRTDPEIRNDGILPLAAIL